jgi:hypothetical protein
MITMDPTDNPTPPATLRERLTAILAEMQRNGDAWADELALTLAEAAPETPTCYGIWHSNSWQTDVDGHTFCFPCLGAALAQAEWLVLPESTVKIFGQLGQPLPLPGATLAALARSHGDGFDEAVKKAK